MISVESFFLKGSANFIKGKTKIYAKYELKLRYLSTKNFLLRSSSLRFNVVLGKLSVLKQQKLFYKGLLKESINYLKYPFCFTLRLRKSVNGG